MGLLVHLNMHLHDLVLIRNHSYLHTADNLEEVNIPIMKTCKTSVDVEGDEICAGEKDGGYDACQGNTQSFTLSLIFIKFYLHSSQQIIQ